MRIEEIEAIVAKIIQILVEEELTISQAENILWHVKTQLPGSKVSF